MGSAWWLEAPRLMRGELQYVRLSREDTKT